MVLEVLEHITGICSTHVDGLDACYFMHDEKAKSQAGVSSREDYTSEES